MIDQIPEATPASTAAICRRQIFLREVTLLAVWSLLIGMIGILLIWLFRPSGPGTCD